MVSIVLVPCAECVPTIPYIILPHFTYEQINENKFAHMSHPPSSLAVSTGNFAFGKSAKQTGKKNEKLFSKGIFPIFLFSRILHIYRCGEL